MQLKRCASLLSVFDHGLRSHTKNRVDVNCLKYLISVIPIYPQLLSISVAEAHGVIPTLSGKMEIGQKYAINT